MTAALAAALVLAVAIGVSLGALGAGGSIVTLPVLVYVAGVPAQTAVAMSLVIVGVTSLFAAGLYYRRGECHTRAVVLLGATGMAGAFFGSYLTHRVSATTLMLSFSVLMLVAGVAMLRGRAETPPGQVCRPARCLGVGAAVGVLTGFLGVGGGFLIVPALILFAGLGAKKAVGSSLAIIAVNCGAGLAGHLRLSNIDWPLTVAFLAFSLAGMLVGTRIAARLSQQALGHSFAWFLIAVAVVIAGASIR